MTTGSSYASIIVNDDLVSCTYDGLIKYNLADNQDTNHNLIHDGVFFSLCLSQCTRFYAAGESNRLILFAADHSKIW